MAIVEPVSHHDNRNMKVLSRCPRLEMSPTTVEAVEQAVEEKVIVRLDDVILFDKQRMNKMMELVGSDTKDGLTRLFEQLWHAVTRQQPKKTEMVMRHGKRWKPALQSIPEEI
ncbi:hypothetical protein FCM35_KLT14411 [Carex littledalei]|uniref:Uncharacterized protein n=1 Tax=Carex littledalei TaxID=544730 RepID=A0A833QJI3_9POAL|nr:hypothetical protein FCM35_KLT14411 [Carex littledalei]